MPTTLTLKNVPDDIYAQLKAAADSHRRSLNQEAIVCLQSALQPRRIDADAQLARLRALRAQLPQTKLTHRQIDRAKRAGRP